MEFFDVFKPFYIFSKIIGVYTFRLSSTQNRLSWNCSFASISYGLIASLSPLLIATLLMNFEIIFKSDDVLQKNNDMKNLWDNLAKFGLICPLLQICYHHCKKNSIPNFFQDVTKFDEKCRKFGIFQSYKHDLKIIKLTVVSLVLVLLVMIAMPITQYLMNLTSQLRMFLSHAMQFFYMIYGIAETFIVVRTVKTRIKKFNVFLEKSVFSSKKHLKQSLKLLDELCDLIDLINETFSMNIIFVLANILAMGTIGTFSLIMAFNRLNNAALLFICLNNLLWIIIQFGAACFVAYTGNSIKNQFYKTSVIGIRRLNSSLNEGLNDEFRDLLRVLKSRNTGIICIFFTIDWNVIFAVSSKEIDLNNLFNYFFNIFTTKQFQMISTLFTYLVITWQTFTVEN